MRCYNLEAIRWTTTYKLYGSKSQLSRRLKTVTLLDFYTMHAKSYYHRKVFKLKGAPSMSTPSHRRGSSYPTTKRLTLHNADDNFQLHGGNTPNAAKRSSLKDADV